MITYITEKTYMTTSAHTPGIFDFKENKMGDLDCLLVLLLLSKSKLYEVENLKTKHAFNLKSQTDVYFYFVPRV